MYKNIACLSPPSYLTNYAMRRDIFYKAYIAKDRGNCDTLTNANVTIEAAARDARHADAFVYPLDSRVHSILTEETVKLARNSLPF